MVETNPQFDAWVASLPATHWAKYDLSACRLGWEAALTQPAEPVKVRDVDSLARNIGVAVVDALHGYTMEFAPSPEVHRDEYDQAEVAAKYELEHGMSAILPPSDAPVMTAEALIAKLCGDKVNGGMLRDMAYTVWSACHNPAHEDGNTDWGNDTLPIVNKAVEELRAALTASPRMREIETALATALSKDTKL